MIIKSILLVEDNQDDVELTLRAFKKNGIKSDVTVVHDGAEALDYLLCTGKYSGNYTSSKPKLVLLDINLPKVGGFEVLRQIRANEQTKFIPVVILSSSKQEPDLIKSYDLGVNSYVCKPVDSDQFSDTVRNLSLYWLQLNEVPRFKG